MWASGWRRENYTSLLRSPSKGQNAQFCEVNPPPLGNGKQLQLKKDTGPGSGQDSQSDSSFIWTRDLNYVSSKCLESVFHGGRQGNDSSDTQAITLGTCGCYLMWQNGLCWCDYFKELEMGRLSWIT